MKISFYLNNNNNYYFSSSFSQILCFSFFFFLVSLPFISLKCLPFLQTRINIITRRAEAAFACMPEKKVKMQTYMNADEQHAVHHFCSFYFLFFPGPFPEGWLQPIVCLHLTLLCFIFSHTRWLHVPFHSNHKSSLCSSSRPPACQLQLQHSSPAMCV